VSDPQQARDGLAPAFLQRRLPTATDPGLEPGAAVGPAAPSGPPIRGIDAGPLGASRLRVVADEMTQARLPAMAGNERGSLVGR